MSQPQPILALEKRSVTDSRGNGDLGIVTAEIALAINCKAGVIKLLNGVEGRKGGGFGLAHIESHASRVKQIQGLGFADVFAYVRFIASDFDEIAMQEDGRLVFLRGQSSMIHWLICQWDEDLGIWSVTTSIPKPQKRGLKILWPKQ